jgi:GNAT superfamily N-acetyltransferase
MEIRRATTRDIDALWAVRTAAIEGISNKYYTNTEIATWAKTYKPNDFERVIQKFFWYVAEVEGVIVGSGFLDKETGQIGGIFVDPKFQRKNIGLQILNRLETVAKEQDINLLHLDATLNAEIFYAAAGYVPIAKSKYHHISGLDFDCIKMEKFISFDLTASTEKEKEFMGNAIEDYNRHTLPPTQKEAFVPLNYCFKDKTKIIAGINAVMYFWKVVYVSILFVDQAYRHTKLGSYLLRKIEVEAKAMGATLVHLDTFDFQAKDFYLKQGYEIFGVLENCPPGHNRYYFKKLL